MYIFAELNVNLNSNDTYWSFEDIACESVSRLTENIYVLYTLWACRVRIPTVNS